MLLGPLGFKSLSGQIFILALKLDQPLLCSDLYKYDEHVTVDLFKLEKKNDDSYPSTVAPHD